MRRMGVKGVLLLFWLSWVPMQAQVATTTLTDTIYHADGTKAAGLVIVSWPAFITAAGQAVPGGSTSVTVGADGVLSLQLAPNAGATPAGSYYTAVYHLDDGTVSREYWSLPVSAAPVILAAVRSTVLPAAVATQTASKSYVDSAVAAALAGQPITGDISFLNRTGDAMVGPLALAGDPVTGTQAANKHYVDAAVAGVSTGLAQKVGIAPLASQAVVQPSGTELQVNRVNGVSFGSQFSTLPGNNGLANTIATPDCAGGCQVTLEQEYKSGEVVTPTQLNSSAMDGTHVADLRGGGKHDIYLNPVNHFDLGHDVGEYLNVASTRSAQSVHQQTTSQAPSSVAMEILHQGLTGGTNQFPASIQGNNGPFFKSTYNAMVVSGTYNTLGQHVLSSHAINCYGVGDCLIGSQFVTSAGGFRDEADEGTHPMDIRIQEDTVVFAGTCGTGCTTGSRAVGVAVTTAPGTQGEGRYLIDKNPAKTISSGSLVGGNPGSSLIGPTASFAGTSFPTSVFLQTTQVAPASANSMAPGTVTLAIATSGVTNPFSTTTAALSQASGVACVTDAPSGFNPTNYEMAQYTVVDGSHLALTLNKVHGPGSTVAVGGLCGYGLEQTVDTVNGIRQVFPVIGSGGAATLYYAGNITPVVGRTGSTSGYVSLNLPIASITRAGGTTTVTTGTGLPVDLNGLQLTIAGVADTSFNGTFAVTTTGPNSLTYANAGTDGTSTGGTVTALTGGYVLYPMAEVLGVLNAQTKMVDGQLTLAANTVPWAAGDAVEEPHYFEESVMADVQYINQSVPRATVQTRAGLQYENNVGPGLHGWSVVNNSAASNYFGNGGTRGAPDAALEVNGVWSESLEAQAGESGVFRLHCNSHGCGKWNSTYNLFHLDSAAGNDYVTYQPPTSALTINMRGANYSFSPQAMTAATVNATTLNAGTVAATTVSAGAVNATTLSVSSTTVAPQTLSFVAPNLSNGSQFCQGFGRSVTPHNSTFYCWWNAAVPFGSLETYGGGDPLQLLGSSLWLNGGPVAIGNSAAIGTNLPGLLNVGSSAQFQVDTNGNVKAANFAGILSGKTGVFGGNALAAGSCTSGTASVPGALVGTPVVVSASDGSLPGALITLSAAVSSANTVTVQACAVGPVTPAALSYNVRVLQ